MARARVRHVLSIVQHDLKTAQEKCRLKSRNRHLAHTHCSFLSRFCCCLLHQEGTVGTDSDTSSGESTLQSDTECSDLSLTPPRADPTPSLSASAAAGPAPPPRDSSGAPMASSAAMSPPPPPLRPSQYQDAGAAASGGPPRPNATTAAAAATAAGGKQGVAKPPGSGAKRKRSKPDESKRSHSKKKPVVVAVGGVDPEALAAGVTVATATVVGGGTGVSSGDLMLAAESGNMAAPSVVASETQAVSSEGGEGVGGVPGWRLALMRPQEELTRKERALEKVARYLDKFGDMFLRPAQKALVAKAREKEQVRAVMVG